MEHPKFIGDRSALAVMLALRARGYDLLVPFGENTRYDLVIDDGERLSKVQCKTGRIRQGSVVFKLYSSYAHHPNPKRPRNFQRRRIRYAAPYEIARIELPTAGLAARAGGSGSSA